ncbi:leucyl/phenylalanyl-tRNA--protein transferase [Aestuariibius sp. 2305UL40-4]|uniref:leucyl/phenylalanyl-tRNA--protein transferase n=1 Tax=Aestuariibius violaceus TaxID=3234132 RepID=UPI00398F4E40
MSESRENQDVFWVDPRRRGIFPLDGFRISRSLRRRILQNRYTMSADQAFNDVVAGCADRDETWINATIADLYAQLHDGGFAHSVEVWEDGELVGGVYGVVIGAAFFGESMFSRRTDASKIALAYLIDRLRTGGFRLFDTQFLTDHLASLGAVEITRAIYKRMLSDAVGKEADFDCYETEPTPQEIIQRNTQTS